MTSGIPTFITDERLHAISLEARTGFRECLRMIDLHAGLRNRSFLNGPIVLTAVATWERFAADLAAACIKNDWAISGAGWDRDLDTLAPWPGSSRARTKHRALQSSVYEHTLDAALGFPVTGSWRVHLSTRWSGQYATSWKVVDFAAETRDTLISHMLSASSARNAVAHRLGYKMASLAQHVGEDGQTLARTEPTHYEWASDNTDKSSTERPTVQHGYARAVVGLFLQLTAITIRETQDQYGFHSPSQLPEAWFQGTIPANSGPCSGMTLWNGHYLLR